MNNVSKKISSIILILIFLLTPIFAPDGGGDGDGETPTTGDKCGSWWTDFGTCIELKVTGPTKALLTFDLYIYNKAFSLMTLGSSDSSSNETSGKSSDINDELNHE